MSLATLENRIAALERQIAEMQTELAKVSDLQKPNWRRTIGMFNGDEGMKAIFDEALRLREVDRRRTRQRAKKKVRAAG
jgi:hypothetical protein